MSFTKYLLLFLNVLIISFVIYFLLLNASKKEGFKSRSINIGHGDVNINKIGNYKDKRSRAFTRHYGRSVGKYTEDPIERCARKAQEDGYTFFGLQHPQARRGRPICFGTNDYSRATKYGVKKNHYVGIVKRFKRVWQTIMKRVRYRCFNRKKKKFGKCTKRRPVRRRVRKLDHTFTVNSSDYGTVWGNAVYEIDNSNLVSQEAKEMIGVIEKKNYSGTWAPVFNSSGETLVDNWKSILMENRIKNNDSITRDGKDIVHYGIIWRQCPKCVGQHKNVFYKRITPWDHAEGDIQSLFTENWTTQYQKNKFNTDFKLYSSYSDALLDNKAWTSCDDSSTNIAFPGTCGPVSIVQGQSDLSNVSFYIEKVDPPNMDGAPTN